MGGHLSHPTRQAPSVAEASNSRFTAKERRAMAHRYATLTGHTLTEDTLLNCDGREEEVLQSYFETRPPIPSDEVLRAVSMRKHHV